MKSKTTKILYWITTILFSLAILMGVIPSEQGKELMTHLGYPLYLMTILGIAKVLGVIAIVQQKYKTLKEWAYAGFTFDILGASLSFYFVGDGLVAALTTLIFLLVMFASYFLWKKVEQLK